MEAVVYRMTIEDLTARVARLERMIYLLIGMSVPDLLGFISML